MAYKVMGLRGGQVVWGALRSAGGRPMLFACEQGRGVSRVVACAAFEVLPNQRLQLTAAGAGVPRGQPSAGRSGARLASALRSVVRWCARGCS